MAPTVGGASPERTFSWTSCSVKNATVSAAFCRSRSARTTRPSARTSAGNGGSGPPARAAPGAAEHEHPPPRARLVARPSTSAGSASAKRSGAPSTRRSSPRSSALQRRREENGTCPITRRASASASPASAIACRVGLREARWRRSSRARRASSPSSMPCAGTSPTTRSVGSVSVPVLSVQTTSTEASDSTALSCCARTPRWAILNAETAAVRLIRRISPSGTRLTIPAVSSLHALRRGCRRG